MQTKEAIHSRRSIRQFDGRPVPPGYLEELIDAARMAPTARNVQPWEFVVVTRKAALEAMAELIENARFLSSCGAAIVVLCQDSKYYLEDGCAATVNILLAAQDLGVSSCWVAGDKKSYCDEIRRMFEVPKGFFLVSIVGLGYSAQADFAVPAKRALKEVLHWEQW